MEEYHSHYSRLPRRYHTTHANNHGIATIAVAYTLLVGAVVGTIFYNNRPVKDSQDSELVAIVKSDQTPTKQEGDTQ